MASLSSSYVSGSFVSSPSSSFSTSSSFSSLEYKSSRRRSFPQRGQIKAAIFASILATIARWLGAGEPEESKSPVEEDAARRSMSDLRVDMEGGGLFWSDREGSGLSARSLPGSNRSGSVQGGSPHSDQSLARPHNFDEGMQGRS